MQHVLIKYTIFDFFTYVQHLVSLHNTAAVSSDLLKCGGLFGPWMCRCTVKGAYFGSCTEVCYRLIKTDKHK